MFNVDLLFEDQFKKDLKRLEKIHMESVISSVLPIEEYAYHVGYLKALGDLSSTFDRLMKSYFEEKTE